MPVSAKRRLLQSFCPIRRQRAVCTAGDGIFRNALSRSEVPADEIVWAVSGCGHDDPAAIHARDCRDIGRKLAYEVRGLQQSQIVESISDNLDWSDAECVGQSMRLRDRVGRPGWEVHDITGILSGTVSGPLAEWKITLLRSGSSRSMTTAALASVAWPQSGTSVVGVNQRRR